MNSLFRTLQKHAAARDVLFLAALSLLVFWPSLHIYFVSDDIAHIRISRQFMTDISYHYYRPLPFATLFLDEHFWGSNPAGYHLTSLMIHTANSLLLYFLAREIHARRFFSLAAALIFLLHPIHSLSIFWLSGRTDTVCALFYFLALWGFLAYLRRNKEWCRWASLGAFVPALFSKEMAASLPAVLLAAVLILNESPLKEKIRRGVRLTLPYWIILAGFVLLRYLSISGEILANRDHAGVAATVIIKNLTAYLGLMIIPGGHVQIGEFLRSHPQLFFVAAALSLLLGLLVISWLRRAPLLLFAAVFILISLLPVLRLMMRWYLYIPSAGFALMAGYLLLLLRQRRKWVAAGFLAALLLLYLILIRGEQRRWIAAGELAREFSGKAAAFIAEHRLQDVLILNLPAELHEVPVMAFGAESFINFRLAERHAGAVQPVHAEVAGFLSLKSLVDWEQVKMERVKPGTFRLILPRDGAHFIFPYDPEIYRKANAVAVGLTVRKPAYTLQVEKVDAAQRATAVVVTMHEPEMTPLWYSRGIIGSAEEAHSR